jgi:hypothetical protein
MNLTVPGVVIVVAIGLLGLLRRGKSAAAAAIAPFTPNRDNDKSVIVQGWTESEMAAAIAEFEKGYRESPFPKWEISTAPINEDVFRLTFPEDIHPQLFLYLINFLVYPIGLDLKGRNISVVGSSKLDPAFGDAALSLNQKAIFYVPRDDKDFDVVYLQSEDGAKRSYSFSGTWKEVDDARMPDGVAELMKSVR